MISFTGHWDNIDSYKPNIWNKSVLHLNIFCVLIGHGNRVNCKGILSKLTRLDLMETRNQWLLPRLRSHRGLPLLKSSSRQTCLTRKASRIHRLIDIFCVVNFAYVFLYLLWFNRISEIQSDLIAKSRHIYYTFQHYKNTFTTQPTATVSYLRRTTLVRHLWPPFPCWCCWFQSALLFWTGERQRRIGH